MTSGVLTRSPPTVLVIWIVAFRGSAAIVITVSVVHITVRSRIAWAAVIVSAIVVLPILPVRVWVVVATTSTVVAAIFTCTISNR